MIKGVIFDVDGVLLDSMSAWENLGERYLAGINIRAEENLSDVLREMSMEEAAEYMIARYGLQKSTDEIVDGLKGELGNFYNKEVLLKKGADRYLQEFRAKGIPMVIATAGDGGNAMSALRRLHVSAFFQRVFTCSEVGSGKSHPRIYHAAALELGSDPGDILVFEDALYALRTAKRAGFKTVAVGDKANRKDREEIRSTGDIYLEEFIDFHEFWKRICFITGVERMSGNENSVDNCRQ